jgi:hypothetical protein
MRLLIVFRSDGWRSVSQNISELHKLRSGNLDRRVTQNLLCPQVRLASSCFRACQDCQEAMKIFGFGLFCWCPRQDLNPNSACVSFRQRS